MDDPTSTALMPPAKSLLDALKELEDLCISIQKRLEKAQPEESLSSTGLKLIAEYRQLLKLRFEMLRKARTLIDEACFQCAVLDALKEASEDVYKNAISKLCHLEKEWHADDEPFADDDEIDAEEEGD